MVVSVVLEVGQCGGSVNLSQFRIQRMIRAPRNSSIILIGQCAGSKKKLPPKWESRTTQHRTLRVTNSQWTLSKFIDLTEVVLVLLNAEESNALSSTSPLCICDLACILRGVTLDGHIDKTLTEIDLEKKSVHDVSSVLLVGQCEGSVNLIESRVTNRYHQGPLG